MRRSRKERVACRQQARCQGRRWAKTNLGSNSQMKPAGRGESEVRHELPPAAGRKSPFHAPSPPPPEFPPSPAGLGPGPRPARPSIPFTLYPSLLPSLAPRLPLSFPPPLAEAPQEPPQVRRSHSLRPRRDMTGAGRERTEPATSSPLPAQGSLLLPPAGRFSIARAAAACPAPPGARYGGRAPLRARPRLVGRPRAANPAPALCSTRRAA